MSTIRILIVEDEVLIAQDIKACLQKEGFKQATIAYDKQEALDELANQAYDIALLDINLEGRQEGIQIAETINTAYQIPFLFITSYSNASILDMAKQTKPMGYIVKPYKRQDIITALNIALHNFSHFSNGFQWRKLEANLEEGISFTPREKEIVEGIYEGKTNQQLSGEQFVSHNTIKTHIKNIYAKLEVHNRSEALIKIRQMLAGS